MNRVSRGCAGSRAGSITLDYGTSPDRKHRQGPGSQTVVYDDALIPQPGGSFGEGRRIADGEVNSKTNIAHNNLELERGAFSIMPLRLAARPSALSA
jgi:hypothetical protein